MVELLLFTDVGEVVGERIRHESLAAPQLLLVECLQVLRRYASRGELVSELADAVVGDLFAFDIEMYDHLLVAARIWDLRTNLTAYDAAYVALSELLGAPLVTTDAKLANAPGNRARIELITTGRVHARTHPA